MPRRNLQFLLLIAIFSLACYQRLPASRYSRVLASAADHIARDYYRPVDDLKLFEGGMKGLMKPLDENSAYISAEKKQDFEEDITKEFGGIGVYVVADPKTKRIEVVLAIPSGPAAAAGVRNGDVILAVDGKSVEKFTLDEASSLLRGKPDTPVTLSVLHSGQSKPVELKIVRQVIHVDTVQGYVYRPDGSWDFTLPGHAGIGYIRITAFAETEGAFDSSKNTLEDLKQTLKDIDAKRLRGLVLDLRNNPGGSLAMAIGVCNLFVASGDIVTTRGRDKSILRRAQANGSAPYASGPPLVVLVNEYSASASEIVSACLQDHHRAVIVGQHSYGKGTVQEVIDLGDGLGTLKLTIATFWRPSGRNIQKPKDDPKDMNWGVMPDPGCEIVVDDDERFLVERWDGERSLARLKGGPAKPAGESVEVVDRVLERAVQVLEGRH